MPEYLSGHERLMSESTRSLDQTAAYDAGSESDTESYKSTDGPLFVVDKAAAPAPNWDRFSTQDAASSQRQSAGGHARYIIWLSSKRFCARNAGVVRLRTSRGAVQHRPRPIAPEPSTARHDASAHSSTMPAM